MSVKIGRIVMGSVQTNCYFLYEEGSHKVIFIDPADQGNFLYEKLKEKGLEVAAIFLTHGHFDHIWGAKELKKCSGAPIYAYEAEKALCESASINVSDQCGRPYTVTPDVLLTDGQEITIEGVTLKVIATPGHTGGSCCFYVESDKILVAGDTLFEGSVGRTDFPTGSMSALIRSIKEKLLVLPGDVKVYPGHGDTTTIENEKNYNPFCQ